MVAASKATPLLSQEQIASLSFTVSQEQWNKLPASLKEQVASQCRQHGSIPGTLIRVPTGQPLVVGGGISIKPSQMRGCGFGAFVEQDVLHGRVVCRYGGRLITKAEGNAKRDRGDGTHIATLTQGDLALDGHTDPFAVMGREAGSFLNDPRNSQLCNVAYNVSQKDSTLNQVFFVASRNICAGEELFWDYGKSYWQHPNNPHAIPFHPTAPLAGQGMRSLADLRRKASGRFKRGEKRMVKQERYKRGGLFKLCTPAGKTKAQARTRNQPILAAKAFEEYTLVAGELLAIAKAAAKANPERTQVTRSMARATHS